MKYYYYDYEDAFLRFKELSKTPDAHIKFVGGKEFPVKNGTTLDSDIMLHGVEITKEQYDKGEPIK